MKIGDKVRYLNNDEEYVIEKDYGNDVFFIGNAESFVDMVSVTQLELYEEEK